jgi:hypothetical protein
LLSQLCSRYLPVGYIDNIAARFWSRPSAGLELSRVLLGERKREAIELESTHGVSAGLAGPHEFGRFWRYWLQLDAQPTHHLDEAALSQLDAGGLGRALTDEILAATGQPTVFKNVICGFQAAWLSRVHPHSLFVHIDRSLPDTCASILQSRIDRYGSAEAWWSLKPSTFEAIASLPDPAAQVVRQVIDCRREFRAELSRAGVRSLTVTYDELCRKPAAVLGAIGDVLASFGQRLEPLPGVPAHLEARSPSPLPAPLAASLTAALTGVSEQ